MKVVIYGRENCPFCTRAKELVQSRNIEHEYIDITVAGLSKQDLEQLTGKPVATVPQIFVDGAHIGGYTELVPLVQKYQPPVVEVEDPNMDYFISERGEGDGWKKCSFERYLSAINSYELEYKKEPKEVLDFDLDNLSFDGLDEAEARNEERQNEADKAAAAVGADADCDGCKI